jgi:succinate dehydrogenase / fumarate reductase membrane anchor subunit
MAVIRTPLGRVLGLGSAKHGVGHFIAQRVTAVALVVLVLWAVLAAVSLAAGDYDSATHWLRSPINAALASLLAITAFWHMSLGARVVIEDYISKAPTKAALLILNIFVCWGGAALTVLSLLKVAFSSGDQV